MSFAVRQFVEQDYDAVVALSDAMYPEYRELPGASNSPAWYPAVQLDDNRPSPYKRVVVDVGTQRIVGYGAIRTARCPWCRLDLMVALAWQKRGAGSALLEQLMADLRALGATSVQARVREDKQEALAFLKKRGFEERHRMYGLRLAVMEAKLTPFAPLLERVAVRGVAITTLAEERASDPGYQRKLYELENAVRPDWPDPDPAPFTPISLTDFLRRLEEADTLPDAFFIAKLDDTYIGYSGMFALGTAVRPEYRQQGIATALKVRTIEYARQHGYQSAITCTANPAMLAINEKLGYRQLQDVVRGNAA